MSDSICDVCSNTMPEDEAYACKVCGRTVCPSCLAGDSDDTCVDCVGGKTDG